MKPNHLIDPADLTIVAGSIQAEHIPAGKLLVSKIFPKGFDIGQAVDLMRMGMRVRRAGWNGKGMHLELQVPDAHSKMTLPYFFMLTAQGDRVPWLCSQTDLLAQDWEVAEADEAPVEPDLIVTGPITAYARECVCEANQELVS